MLGRPAHSAHGEADVGVSARLLLGNGGDDGRGDPAVLLRRGRHLLLDTRAQPREGAASGVLAGVDCCRRVASSRRWRSLIELTGSPIQRVVGVELRCRISVSLPALVDLRRAAALLGEANRPKAELRAPNGVGELCPAGLKILPQELREAVRPSMVLRASPC